MKFVSYSRDDQDQLAMLIDGKLYDTDLMHPNLPGSMNMFLNYWEDLYDIAQTTENTIEEGRVSRQHGIDYGSVEVLAPVPHATSCRIGNAFRHTSFNVIPEFYQYPVFYFVNHNSIKGAGEIYCMPDHLENLDFELQLAVVISKPGKNIKAENADDYFYIKSDNSIVKIRLDEILYMEADGNYVHIVAGNEKFTVRLSLTQAMEKIHYSKLLRINRSMVVNVDAIQSFNKEQVMVAKHEISIGKNYKGSFFRLFGLGHTAADDRFPI